MKISREERMTHPYVVGADDLEKLCDRWREWISDLKFEITSKDGLKREFSQLSEILQFENPPTKDIIALRIAGCSKDLRTRVWLSLNKDTVRNISISLEGDE